MSYELIKSVRSLKLRSTVKHVALTLATYADKENYCYPSIALLMEDTGLSNRCVIDCLRELESSKIIVADRSNGRHTYYSFTDFSEFEPVNSTTKPVNVKAEKVKLSSGSPVNVIPSPVNVIPSPVNVTQDSCREVHTNNQLTTIQQPIGTTNSKIKKQVENLTYPKPDDVSDEIWSEFVKHRKRKKAPITNLVMKAIIREAGKANYSLEAALTKTIERNWQTFEASWVASNHSQSKTVENHHDFSSYIQDQNIRDVTPTFGAIEHDR